MSSIITAAVSPRGAIPPARSRRRWWVAIGLLLYTVIGFFVVPVIIKWQLHKQLPGLTHRQAAVKQVRVNPYALSLTVRGLSLTETNGAPFAGFDELYVNFQLSSLFRLAWTFREVKLAGPTANVIRFTNGEFNFANLLATHFSPGAAASAPPAALVQRFSITNALLHFTDHTTPTTFQTVYGPTHIELKNLSTRPDQHGPYSILAKTDDGETFAWSGTISVYPPQSRGEFKLLNIPPAKYGPYLAHFTTMRVARGNLDVSAAYTVNAAGFPPLLDVSNVVVRLRDFQLNAPERDESLLMLNELLVQNASANLTGATVRVPLVKLNGGSVFIRRNAQGRLEAEEYVFPPTNSFVLIRQLAAKLRAAVTADLQAALDELRVEDFAATAEDLSLPSVARLGLDELDFSLKGLSNQTNAPLSASLSFHWRGGGRVALAARGTALPITAQADLAISNFALAPLQPYVESQTHLAVQSGELNVEGRAQFDPHATGTALLRFVGNVGVTNFHSSDTITHHEFAAWDNMGIDGIRFELKPNRLEIDEVKFSGLRTSLVISSNGQLNVLALRKTLAAMEFPAFVLKLGALVFERGSVGAADESLTPRFQTRIEEFAGSVRDITFPGLTRARVDVRGKVSALAPFAVTGTLTPDLTNPFVDLQITSTNTDLTPFTPYGEKFAGYPILKGKLTFDVNYLIENRRVQGQNVLALDQFTFGARTGSPHATKLPVKLGVALLKDRNGRIELDLPVSGSLDDPSFRIGGLVWQAIVNALTKAATSPFAVLGALVGGSEELQYVDFDAGLALLDDSGTNKLVKLAKALDERPALHLEIAATFDATDDEEALGRQKVLEKMKALRAQEMVARGRTAPTLRELTLAEDEYERLLRKAYRDAFATTPEQALREALLAAAATNTAEGVALRRTTPAPGEHVRGATRLIQPRVALNQLEAQSLNRDEAATPAKPRSESEVVRAELERRLMTTVPVTDADRQHLAQQRISAVQKFLIEAGNIAADRLFPVAPGAGGLTRGDARVVFSLN